MQSGTTGINAMRVYSVTKQGKDQDPKGIFIKKYVPELQNVPISHIHEPWKMPLQLQTTCNTKIGTDYPYPIVNEQESAKLAKNKVAAIRKLGTTRELANQVYQKHGSRNQRAREREDGRKPKALSSTAVDPQQLINQATIHSMFPEQQKDHSVSSKPEATKCKTGSIDNFLCERVSNESSVLHQSTSKESKNTIKRHFSPLSTNNSSVKRQKSRGKIVDSNQSWSCETCTFLNDKPLGLVCSMCNTPRT